MILSILVNGNFLSSRKKDTEIREQEMEVVRLADKKDSEKKAFNWKVIGTGSFIAFTVVGIGAAALGGKVDFKLPKLK